MERTGSTRERKARALTILANGPWPTRLGWMLFHDRDTYLAGINAERTLQSLVRAGKVVERADSTGEKLWRLAEPEWSMSAGCARLSMFTKETK